MARDHLASLEAFTILPLVDKCLLDELVGYPIMFELPKEGIKVACLSIHHQHELISDSDHIPLHTLQ